jgi:hypothetical protein
MVLLGRSRYLGLFSSPGRKDKARAQERLHEVGLFSVAAQRYDRLSGGQRQLCCWRAHWPATVGSWCSMSRPPRSISPTKASCCV